jgi:hypothetical protein
MKGFESILEKKYVAFACILVSVICRTINLFFVSFAGRDKMMLLLQSKSFLEGKGLSVPQYFTTQLETPVYDYTQFWPPGYSLIIAPFLKLFNYNIYWATSVFDLIIGIALIFTLRKISMQLGFPALATNIMTLIAGCFEYPFTGQSLPTDTVSLLFILIAISFSIKITSSNKFSFKQIFFTGFLLFLPCLFRYSYPPISIGIPLVIVLFSFIKKDGLLMRKGLWVTAITALLIVLLFVLLKFTTGQSGYVTPTERGYFPENIIHWYPVIPGSFIDFPFFTSQVIHISGISLVSQLYVLEVINIVSVVILTALFFYFLFIKKIFREINSFKWLILWSWVCAALTFLSLGWLSFTYQKQRGYESDWNYIYEARYYGLVIIFLQLIYLGWVFLTEAWKKILWQKFIIVSCAALLFIEITHSIYFNTKLALNFTQYKSAIYREQDYNYFNSLLLKLEKENPAHELLVAAPNDNFYTYTAAYFGKKGIFDAANLKTMLPKVKTKSLLVVMLYNDEFDAYQNFISHPKTRIIQQVAYSNFFLLELIP